MIVDRHLTEDEIAQHYYGELTTEAETAANAHFEGCGTCRGQLDELRRVMAMVDAGSAMEPDGGFEARVWQRLEPSLPRHAQAARSWTWMAAAAVLILAAFIAGRYWPAAAPVPVASNDRPAGSVLLVDLGGHLDQAEMTLVEFGSMPIVDPAVRERTEDLIAANRLYRGTAMTTGDEAVARILDELERALIEIATAPPDAPDAELEELRQRIDSGGLLLKLRVMRDVLQDRVPAGAPPREDSSL